MSSLPKFAGQLSIDFQDDFKNEKLLHTTDEYLELLHNFRRNITKDNVCCYCGFPDGRFLEIHHVNGDHTDYSHDNLQSICTLCHRIKHLGWVGINNLGKIIYIPTLIEPKKTRIWLEPLQIIQRFYLMKGFLSSEERKRLGIMGITNDIEDLLNKLKSQDFDTRYVSFKEEETRYKIELDEIKKADPQKKSELIEKVRREREERQQKLESLDAGNQFSELHILDLLEIIVETGKKEQFLSVQNAGIYGRVSIWFNETVFKPFEPDPEYTLEERLSYYNELGYFTADGVRNIMQNLRTS